MVDSTQTKFYVELGIDRTVIVKQTATKSVLDLRAGLEKIKEVAAHTPNKSLFNESEDESRERKTRQRQNAFTMRYLEPLLTSSFLDDFDNKRLMDRVKIDSDLIKRIYSWTPESPFKIDGTNRARAYYLAGPSGIGKSTLMQAHAIKLYDDSSEQDKMRSGLVRVLSISEFFGKFYNAKEEHVKAGLEANFIDAKFLFIDDIGAEKFSDGKEDILKNLLQRRLDNEVHKQKWTFFSSNYEIANLPYGETIVRRIHDLAREIKVGQTFTKKQSYITKY